MSLEKERKGGMEKQPSQTGQAAAGKRKKKRHVHDEDSDEEQFPKKLSGKEVGLHLYVVYKHLSYHLEHVYTQLRHTIMYSSPLLIGTTLLLQNSDLVRDVLC